MPGVVSDTISAAATLDSVPQPYVARHADHFSRMAADSVTAADADSLAAPAALPPVMTVPATTMPRPLPPAPIENNVVTGMTVAAVFFAVASYRVGYKYFDNIFHNIVSTRRRENLFEDHTFNETQILAALIMLTCVCQGVIAHVHLGASGAALAAAGSVAVPALAALSLAFYLVQLAVCAVLGWVFLDGIDRKLWLDGYKSSQALLGVTLAPVAVAMLVMPQYQSTLFIATISLFFLARILFVLKGMRIFLVNFSSLVPFILYLCAVEIAPIAAVVRLARVLCDFLLT
ncbi:MAG: DUF4271 domain-containing protein [Muribaculaceae bacterium]|nr:DUF4271 domain-containing protein [Muribaculaceae bacterium]